MIESLAARIRDKWWPVYCPGLPVITTTASLAHHGFLLSRSVKNMWLRDVDLASVPADHLASLVACVTERVRISNVHNTDLTSILDNSKSKWLGISNQSLSTEETRALVRAMANVKRVSLGYNGEVTVDISTLVTYSGRGECKEVRFYDITAYKYREEIRRWAQRISWRVTQDNNSIIIIRKQAPLVLWLRKRFPFSYPL